MYFYLFKQHFHFDARHKFWLPSFEVKLACESAERNGADLEFLDNELGQNTWNRLFHETRLTPFSYLAQRFMYGGYYHWKFERQTNADKLALVGPEAFTEKCLDSYLCNWYTASMATFFPHLKRVIVDDRSEDIFRAVQKSEGKRVVVVVNQWHMENFEHHWAHHYGQIPRSVRDEEINPIGDMDLREGLFEMLYNALQRRIVSS
jgi:pheromone shutdown protein TraB